LEWKIKKVGVGADMGIESIGDMMEAKLKHLFGKEEEMEE